MASTTFADKSKKMTQNRCTSRGRPEQDATIEDASHAQQDTGNSGFAQLTNIKLVALISSDQNQPAKQRIVLATISNNKRNSTDSPKVEPFEDEPYK
jgi:hypothetical protein